MVSWNSMRERIKRSTDHRGDCNWAIEHSSWAASQLAYAFCSRQPGSGLRSAGWSGRPRECAVRAGGGWRTSQVGTPVVDSPGLPRPRPHKPAHGADSRQQEPRASGSQAATGRRPAGPQEARVVASGGALGKARRGGSRGESEAEGDREWETVGLGLGLSSARVRCSAIVKYGL